ncbi:hypothetical protein [Haloactinospora alba]|nr:hypothetical protein [Haloactinospora alba]
MPKPNYPDDAGRTLNRINGRAREAWTAAQSRMRYATIRAASIILGSPSGQQTELSPSGIHVTDSGTEYIRIGYGIPTGMSIRDPNTGSMVELSPHAFGIKSEKKTNKWTINTSHSESSWKHDSDLLTFTPVSSRVLAMISFEHTTSQGSGWLDANLDFVSGNDVATAAPQTHTFLETYITEQPISAHELVEVTPGTEYTIRFAARSNKPWHLQTRTATIIPM